MTANLESAGGRKFIVTVLSGSGTWLLALFGIIDGTIYSTVTIATVAAFIAGNATQSVMETRATAPYRQQKDVPEEPTA